MASRQAADGVGESFQGLLLRHRGRTGLTQRELAARVGVSKRTLQDWEAGVSYPGAEHLQALIAAFLASDGQVLGYEGIEAHELWSAALREAPRLHTPFDPTWFAELLQQHTASARAPDSPARPSLLAKRNDEASRGPSHGDEKASRERVPTHQRHIMDENRQEAFIFLPAHINQQRGTSSPMARKVYGARGAVAQGAGVPVAVTYRRVSSDDQADLGVSLAAQTSEITSYVTRMGWVLDDGDFHDILSGKRDDRPGYQAALGRVRQLRTEGKRVVLVVAALDRLGRRLIERLRARDEFKALDVATHSVREGGEVSDLVASILGAVAEEEVRRLGLRVRQSVGRSGTQGLVQVLGVDAVGLRVTAVHRR